MAKIKVMGDTVQICTALTVEDIKKTKFYKPEALELRDEKGEPYFAIGMGNAHYGKSGVLFSSMSYEGKAFMTTANPVTNDHSNRVAEQEILTRTFAGIIANLNKVELQVINAMDAIDDIECETAEAIMFVDEAVTVEPEVFVDECENCCNAPCTPVEESEE